MDWGTYVSNAVVSVNRNGLLNLMDNYDNVKEFFSINLDAFITAESMKYFGMDTVTSTTTIQEFAPSLKNTNTTTKRQWLHEQVSNLLDEFVMDGITDLQSIHDDLANPAPTRTEHPCRHPICNRTFVFVKCLLKHERCAMDLT